MTCQYLNNMTFTDMWNSTNAPLKKKKLLNSRDCPMTSLGNRLDNSK